MFTKTGTALCVIVASLSQANAENCALPWPYSVNVVDAHGRCVGTIVNVNSTVVARRIGDAIYGIQINAQIGIQKGLATFFYPTADCSGPAYMEDDANLPQSLWSDLNGILWTNGPSGAITVESGRQAPAGSCFGFHLDTPLAAGPAVAIDNSLVNTLVPPLSVAVGDGKMTKR